MAAGIGRFPPSHKLFFKGPIRSLHSRMRMPKKAQLSPLTHTIVLTRCWGKWKLLIDLFRILPSVSFIVERLIDQRTLSDLWHHRLHLQKRASKQIPLLWPQVRVKGCLLKFLCSESWNNDWNWDMWVK